MIIPVPHNLYISVSEERKAGFSLYLYASEKCRKTFPWNLLWLTICSVAAMCLIWALDTKQTPIVENDNWCSCQSLPVAGDHDLPNPECLSLSGGSLCMCVSHQGYLGGCSMKYLEFMDNLAYRQATTLNAIACCLIVEWYLVNPPQNQIKH